MIYKKEDANQYYRKYSNRNGAKVPMDSFADESEYALIFLLEIGSEDVLANGGEYFLLCPKSTAVKFVSWFRREVGDCPEHVHILPLAAGFKYIRQDMLGLESLQTEFFPGLAPQRIFHIFSVIHMASYSSVPFAGLYVFPVSYTHLTLPTNSRV